MRIALCCNSSVQCWSGSESLTQKLGLSVDCFYILFLLFYILKYSDGVWTSFTPIVFLLPQLAYCVVQFLEKDPTLTEPVIFVFSIPPTQSAGPQALNQYRVYRKLCFQPPTGAGCCKIYNEFPVICAGDPRASEVLAKNLQPERGIPSVVTQSACTVTEQLFTLPLASLHWSSGHVLRRNWGDSRRHRAYTVQENPGAAV